MGDNEGKSTQTEKLTQIDTHSPLYLHPSEGPNSITMEKLKGSGDFKKWRRSMEIALAAKRKLGFGTGVVKRDATDEVKAEQWDTCNSVVLSWIHNNVSTQIKDVIMYVDSAKRAWDMLNKLFNVSNGLQKFKLERQLFYTQQEDASVTEYYAKMKALWEEKEAMRVLPPLTELSPEINEYVEALNKEREELRLIQFLNGIDDLYGGVRTQVLQQNPLPSVEVACGNLMQEELQRDVLGTVRYHGEISAMYGKTQPQPGNYTGRTGKSGENSAEKMMVCTACGKKGHSKEKCWTVAGYPKWHAKHNKQGEVSNTNNRASMNRGPGRRLAANVCTGPAGEGSSSGQMFTAKQVEELLKLIPGTNNGGSDTEEEIDGGFAGLCKREE